MGTWNDQATSPGHSSNVPRDRIANYDGQVAPTTSIAFWDSWNPGGLDPSNESRSAWDVVTLGGWELPGRCSVDAKQARRVDPKIVAQVDFATLTYKGRDPAEITITCAIWTSAQFDVLVRQMDVLREPARDVSAPASLIHALDIFHPSLVPMRITQVLIKSLTNLKETGVKGVREMKIHAIEYNKSTKPAGGTANASSLSPGLISSTQPRLQTPGMDDSYLAPLVPFKP